MASLFPSDWQTGQCPSPKRRRLDEAQEALTLPPRDPSGNNMQFTEIGETYACGLCQVYPKVGARWTCAQHAFEVCTDCHPSPQQERLPVVGDRVMRKNRAAWTSTKTNWKVGANEVCIVAQVLGTGSIKLRNAAGEVSGRMSWKDYNFEDAFPIGWEEDQAQARQQQAEEEVRALSENAHLERRHEANEEQARHKLTEEDFRSPTDASDMQRRPEGADDQCENRKPIENRAAPDSGGKNRSTTLSSEQLSRIEESRRLALERKRLRELGSAALPVVASSEGVAPAISECGTKDAKSGSGGSSSTLTAEQLSRIEEKRRLALERKRSRELGANGVTSALDPDTSAAQVAAVVASDATAEQGVVASSCLAAHSTNQDSLSNNVAFEVIAECVAQLEDDILEQKFVDACLYKGWTSDEFYSLGAPCATIVTDNGGNVMDKLPDDASALAFPVKLKCIFMVEQKQPVAKKRAEPRLASEKQQRGRGKGRACRARGGRGSGQQEPLRSPSVASSSSSSSSSSSAKSASSRSSSATPSLPPTPVLSPSSASSTPDEASDGSSSDSEADSSGSCSAAEDEGLQQSPSSPACSEVQEDAAEQQAEAEDAAEQQAEAEACVSENEQVSPTGEAIDAETATSKQESDIAWKMAMEEAALAKARGVTIAPTSVAELGTGVVPHAKREGRSAKQALVAQLLCRWWYALPPWPPLDFDYDAALAARGFRRVPAQVFDMVPDIEPSASSTSEATPAPGLRKVLAVPAYLGLYHDAEGKLVDVRPLEGRPSYDQLMRRSLPELHGLLVTAFENQLREMEAQPNLCQDEQKHLANLRRETAEVKHKASFARMFMPSAKAAK